MHGFDNRDMTGFVYLELKAWQGQQLTCNQDILWVQSENLAPFGFKYKMSLLANPACLETNQS